MVFEQYNDATTNRRRFLERLGAGFGGVALAAMVDRELSSTATGAEVRYDLSPKPSPRPAKAKAVIQLFMHGGPSHVDTFEPKPLLDRDDGKPYPGERPRVVFAKTGKAEERGKPKRRVPKPAPVDPAKRPVLDGANWAAYLRTGSIETR